ncbi:hypothetical protein L7F22_063052 [Adiantum nelumboides]|nr:hypothetical protein [Adiantum nelumboides]
MAEHLASIFGTEKDRVNCPFYFKIGACRHGDRCSRLHNRPTISPTLLFSNMYQRPDYTTPGVNLPAQNVDPRKVQEHFEDFYEDIFEELSKYGDLESLNVCDNMADHMVGNVYAQFREEEQAAAALQGMTGRFYAGRPIIVDFSPVTDFREATCRQYEENTCNRGGYCNFMHLKKTSRELRKKLFGNHRRHSRSRSRSLSPRKEYERRDRPHDDFYAYGGGRGGRYGGDERRYDRDDRSTTITAMAIIISNDILGLQVEDAALCLVNLDCVHDGVCCKHRYLGVQVSGFPDSAEVKVVLVLTEALFTGGVLKYKCCYRQGCRLIMTCLQHGLCTLSAGNLLLLSIVQACQQRCS